MNEFVWTDELVLLALDQAHHNGYHKFPQRCVEVFDEVKNQAMHGGYKYPKWVTDHIQSKNNQDWEILSVATSVVDNHELPFQGFMLKYPHNFPIKKVKVLSSGEIFSVGDKVADLIGDYYSDKSIAAFKIQDNDVFVIMNDLKGTFLIQHIKKHKPILFTTETIMENKKQTVTLEIDDAVNVASDLADLLCWWEGFKVGRQSSGIDNFIVAENGISAARNLNEKIKAALK